MKEALPKSQTMGNIKYIFNSPNRDEILRGDQGQQFLAEHGEEYQKYSSSQGQPTVAGYNDSIWTKATGAITGAFAGVSAWISQYMPAFISESPYAPYIKWGLGIAAVGATAYGVKRIFFSGPTGPTKEEL